MNNNLLILCEGTYGSVVKEIAESLRCYEQITVLTSRYGTETTDANYHEIGDGNINDYEKYASKYTYGIAVFEDAKERLDWTQKLVDEGLKIISLVSPKIDFFFDRRKMMNKILALTEAGVLPERVTHNDTKLNNVLIDNATEKALCVIDLDTVMPGSILYDYGDAIRYGACTAAEDEPDLSKIGVDMNLFRLFTDGFVSEIANTITEDEIKNLPLGVLVITCELAMRFLTDYINGDEYFKVKYPEHNLVRAHAQMKLLEEFEAKYDEMQAYVCGLLK